MTRGAFSCHMAYCEKNPNSQKHKELAREKRISYIDKVKEEYQNQGIAGLLLRKAMEVLKQRGYAYVHFLVSKEHTKALRAYEKLNFDKVGECNLYDGNWWCYEKTLTNKSETMLN